MNLLAPGLLLEGSSATLERVVGGRLARHMGSGSGEGARSALPAAQFNYSLTQNSSQSFL